MCAADFFLFFFNDTAATEIYTLSYTTLFRSRHVRLEGDGHLVAEPALRAVADHAQEPRDRKSTRLNSSHPSISYAVFCLKKKKKNSLTGGLNLINRHNEVHLVLFGVFDQERS